MKLPEIAIAAILSNFAGRQRLAGMFDHLGTAHRWNLHVMRDKDEVAAFFAEGGGIPHLDGVIYAGPYTPGTFDVLASLGCPVVVMEGEAGETEALRRGLSVLVGDADRIVRAAVDSFVRLGHYRTYAFVGSMAPDEWSLRRETAFRRTVAAAVPGRPKVTVSQSLVTDIHADRAFVAQFLKGLEYPAAVLAANDVRAMAVVEAAKAAGISVPGKVSVLGIDNDPCVCDSVSPGISSVEPDFRREGKAAAALLDRLMRSRSAVAVRRMFTGAARVVFRESTPPLPPAENVVSRAKEFIARHAAEGITPADVAAHLGVSRSLLDLRFRETQKTTVGRLITDTRLAEVERRLRQTRVSIGILHDLCGFPNANALKNLFKARHGMSMRQWRAMRGR